jgi:hypothetical protein
MSDEQKNWYIVEVELDGKHHGKFVTYEESEQDARDTIADCMGNENKYDTITLCGSLYHGDVSQYDTDNFYEVDGEHKKCDACGDVVNKDDTTEMHGIVVCESCKYEVRTCDDEECDECDARHWADDCVRTRYGKA